MTLKISIVTLSFNQREYLQEAIESVLGQNYPALEHIVVDPGSTDGSRELLQRYAPRISQLIFEPDNGPSDGLNKGFSRASGEVLGFLNADDLLLPGALHRVAEFFRQHATRELLFGNGFIIDAQGKRVRHIKARGFTLHRYCYGGTRFLQQSTFFRRSAFDRSHRFNLANRTCWDGELFVDMVKQGASIGYLSADLGAFRVHEASISGSGRLNSAYEKDNRRIFRSLKGRDKGTYDEFIELAFRAEGILIRIGSLWDRVRGSGR